MESHELDDALTLGVRQMAAEARDNLKEHPSPDTLLAYDAEELSEDESTRVREHLAVCPDCARTVLDLASFPEIEPGPGVEPLSPEAEKAQWQRVLDRLEEEEARKGEARGTGGGRWGGVHLLAAVLGAIGLGLGLWVAWLHVQPAGPGAGGSRAGANVFEIDLVPVGAPVARSEEGVQVPAGMDSILLRLNLGNLRPFDDVRVTVRREGGEAADQVVWEREGLIRNPQGHFSVHLPREALPAGSYGIELLGEVDGQTEDLAIYELRLQYGE